MGKGKLPDAEFEVMRAVWECGGQVSGAEVQKRIDKEWKLQTILTLLGRLADRGFLSTEKVGNERRYVALITEQEYLRQETDSFLDKYHKNSFASLFATLYEGKKLGEEELAELRDWLDSKEGEK